MDLRRIQMLRKMSQKQESRTAKEMGGKTQIASGAINRVGMKGDVRSGSKSTTFNDKDWLIENKLTTTDEYKLDLKTWEKIAKEARRDGFRIPVMQIDIKDLELIVCDYRLMHSLYKNHSVFCVDKEFKKSISLKYALKSLDRDIALRGDIMIVRLYSDGLVELGLILKKYWNWRTE